MKCNHALYWLITIAPSSRLVSRAFSLGAPLTRSQQGTALLVNVMGLPKATPYITATSFSRLAIDSPTITSVSVCFVRVLDRFAIQAWIRTIRLYHRELICINCLLFGAVLLRVYSTCVCVNHNTHQTIRVNIYIYIKSKREIIPTV